MSTTAMSSVVKTMTSTTTTTPVKPKKVEVRWLESESELYLKQWQHRYHQMHGVDQTYRHHPKNGRQLQLTVTDEASLDDPFDDWCLSSKSLLDLDLDFDFSDSKINNIIISNCNPNEDSTESPVQPSNPLKTSIAAFDHIFWSDDTFGDKQKNKNNKRIKSSIEDKSLNLSCDSTAFDDEEIVLTVDGYVIRQKNGGIVTTEEDDESFGGSSYENQRFSPIKRVVHKTKASGKDCNKNEIVLSEKERQFSIDLSKKLELLAKDQALNEQNGDQQTNKAVKPKPSRARDRTRPPRPRPPPIRRQIFKCEHIGCSYQSDRNFNFLRHKRTHCKNKTEEEANKQSVVGVTTTAAVQPTTTTTAMLADISGVKPTQTLVIINSNNSSTTHPTHQTLKLFTNHNSIATNTSNTLSNISNMSNISTISSMSTNISDPMMSSASQSLATTSDAGTNTNTIVNITSVVSPEELQAIKTSIDCLLNNCDSNEDNVNAIGTVNNSSCDELSSYHQKVVFV